MKQFVQKGNEPAQSILVLIAKTCIEDSDKPRHLPQTNHICASTQKDLQTTKVQTSLCICTH